jgi:hypothetical protein
MLAVAALFVVVRGVEKAGLLDLAIRRILGETNTVVL